MKPDRTQVDTLGAVAVPAERLWGPQTQRCLANFPIGGSKFRWGRQVVRSFGIVKKCAALANGELGRLPVDKVDLIVRAADEVLAGTWDDEFPLVIFQSGSGTQSNMNANEVIANRAIQLAGGLVGSNTPIHPNDDVNLSQSSNDVFPTVMHLATVQQLEHLLIPAVGSLRESLASAVGRHTEVVMVGRTHLQDATPVTLGQVFSGWAAQLDDALAGIRSCIPALTKIPMGGTAVGTGLHAPAAFGDVVARRITEETGRTFEPAGNKFAALSAHDAMVSASGAIRTLAGALMKIANDVRWYGSGPRAGIGELLLPENEPGSSIMPGKINPTQCEALTQVVVQVFGNDHTVAFAGSQGNFQLNTFKPVILYNVLESIELLAAGCRSFDERCVRDLKPNLEAIRSHLEASLMLVTALSPHIGYDKAARIALMAHREGTTLRDAALKLGYVSPEDFDLWVRPQEMTRTE